MLRNVTFVVQIAYFASVQIKELFLATVEQFSLQKRQLLSISGNFLVNLVQLAASPTSDGFCVGGQGDSKRSASYQLEVLIFINDV